MITSINIKKQKIYLPHVHKIHQDLGIPFEWDALFILDGDIVNIGGSYYFADKSGNGRDFLIIGYDFNSTWEGGLPYKSTATISAPVGDAVLIAADIYNFLYDIGGTPNQIPVVSLFQDVEYSHKLFCKHASQIVDGDGVETYEPRVLYMVFYNTVKTGADLTICQTFYSVPAEELVDVHWVDGVNGDDTTGTGTKLLPWKSITKLNASGTTGRTAYIRSATYTAQYWLPAKTFNVVGVGLCVLRSSATDYLVYVTNTTFTWNNLIFDGQDTCTNIIQVFQANENTFNRCLFKREKTCLLVDNTGTVHTLTNCVFDSRLANTAIPLPMQLSNFDTCYVSNAMITTAGTGDCQYLNCKFKNTRTSPTRGIIISGGTNGTMTIKGCDVYYYYSGIANSYKYNVSYCNFYAYQTSALALGGTGVNIELTCNHCKFIHDDTTPTPATPFFINLENIKGFDIQNNYFHAVTKHEYYPIYIISNAIVTGTKKINYNYIEHGAFVGTIIRLNGELGFNNICDGCEVIGNHIKGHRYYYPDDGTSGIHGMMLSDSTNMVIKYNYIQGCHLGIVVKNGSTGEAYISGGIFYNLLHDCIIGIYVRGVKGINIFNNTIYHSSRAYASAYRIGIIVDTNTVLAPPVVSENVILKNNIYDIDTTSIDANIVFDAWAAAHGCIAEHEDMYGGSFALTAGATTYNTVALAQAAGWMDDSIDDDPLLTNLIPQAGSPSIGMGEDEGVDYDDGLDDSTDWGTGEETPTIVTKQQGASWDCGAYIH